jgi:hypothetical protein
VSVPEDQRQCELDREIADLRYHWGSAYEITVWSGIYRAERRDDGSAVTAITAGCLKAEIRADYLGRPVPRDACPQEGPR